MVLINGVKYACERCIRGHRVTTCTHTDQPLTMIKPKGRPATQCQHCREQRKLKSLHISCSCNKKGGAHAANCLKNPAGCTCYHHHKMKITDKAKKKDKTKEIKDLPKDSKLAGLLPDESLKLDEEFIKSNSDLFEFLNSREFDDIKNVNSIDKFNLAELQGEGSKSFDKQMDFPLFPLIGTQSFDNENMPLSPFSTEVAKKGTDISNVNTVDNGVKKETSAEFGNGSISSELASSLQSILNSNNGNSTGTVNQLGMSHNSYQAIAPIGRSHSFKNRPSSVLSVNSNSSISTDSKFDAAFPPSGSISNINSSSNLNISQSIPNGIVNPAPSTMKYPFSNILESNELHILDEDIEHFLDDYDNTSELLYNK